jgi:CRP-like cAMP-binding protein
LETLRASRRFFKKGSIILGQGESDAKIYTLYTGWAARFRISRDGRRQIFSFHMPGDLVGADVLLGFQEPFGIRALTDVTVCEFDAPALLPLLTENTESISNLLSDILQRNMRRERALFSLGSAARKSASRISSPICGSALRQEACRKASPCCCPSAATFLRMRSD